MLTHEIELPDGITAHLEGNHLKIIGPKGEITKNFKMPVKLKLEDKKITVEAEDSMYLNTAKAHIKNMIKGVQNPFTKHLKVLYAHFPITIEVKGSEITIKNFLGEKKPRKANIIGKVKVEVKGKELVMSSTDKESLGQTLANLKKALKIKEKDSRIFQDGIYEVEVNE